MCFQPKSLSAIFQSPESQLKNSYRFRLTTSRNRSSPEDDFRKLVSSNPLFRYRKLTFRCHQIMEDDLPGPGQFQTIGLSGGLSNEPIWKCACGSCLPSWAGGNPMSYYVQITTVAVLFSQSPKPSHGICKIV